MKIKVLFLIGALFITISCTQITTPPIDYNKNSSADCDNIELVDWKNMDDTIKTYESCTKYKPNKNKQNYSNIKKAQTDSKLYLSYIHLTPGEYQNTEQANKLLKEAISEMSVDCKDAHGPHDNFCYMIHFPKDEPIPTDFETLDDAMHIYHMSLPCVHVDMIKENPKTLDLLGAYFGSLRDVNIPVICNDNKFGQNSILSIKELSKLDNYKNIQKLNSGEEETGTMRFMFYTINYQKTVELMLFPEQALKEFEPDNVSIEEPGFVEKGVDRERFYAKDIENEIYKYHDLKTSYEAMILKTEKYYINNLGLDKVTAQKYSRMVIQLVLLQDIYNM